MTTLPISTNFDPSMFFSDQTLQYYGQNRSFAIDVKVGQRWRQQMAAGRAMNTYKSNFFLAQFPGFQELINTTSIAAEIPYNTE